MTSRSYIWQTERPREQQVFLATVCKVYRKYTQGRLPSLLNLNFQIDEVATTGSMSPPTTHAQPALYQGGAPSMSSSSLAAPPLLRSRQGSHSSVASSSMTGAESHYAASSLRQGRPSVDSRRAEGSFSSVNPAESALREGPYPSPGSAAGHAMQQYTPVPGMGKSASDVYDPSPLQHSSSARYPEEQYSQSRTPGLAIPNSDSQRSLRDQSPTPQPQFVSQSPAKGSYPNSGYMSPTERPNGLATRNVSEARTPTQATYGFREQAIPPPSTSQLPVQQPQPPQLSNSSEFINEGYGSESAMPTPIPTQTSGFDQTPIPSAFPKRARDESGRSEESKRAMLAPIVTNPSMPKNPARALQKQRGSREAEPRPAEREDDVRPTVVDTRIPEPQVELMQQPVRDHEPIPDSQPQTRARRASFVEAPAATPYSRDLLLRAGSFAKAEALLEQDEDDGEDMEDATMANVEEILEGFDWGNHMVEYVGSERQGSEAIEARLLDELNALEAVSLDVFGRYC
jgi:hypothetical protein